MAGSSIPIDKSKGIAILVSIPGLRVFGLKGAKGAKGAKVAKVAKESREKSMLNLEQLNTQELVDLSQQVSFAIDMASNEESYTILDEIENIIHLREREIESNGHFTDS